MADERRPIELLHDDGVNAWRRTSTAAPPELRREIDGYADYWERTQGFTVRRELPHPDGVLIVNLGDPIAITGGDGGTIRLGPGEAFVAGVHLRPALSQSNGAQAGIHVFLPLSTLRRLLATRMDALVDRVVPLDALLGRSARELGEALGAAADAGDRAAILDDALWSRLRDAPALDPRTMRALALLRTRPGRDIAGIADEIGWSRKHLADRVRDAVGIGPRSFRRLLRFQRLIRRVESDAAQPDWADVALASGYCDQSHMIREFREFGGLAPSAYLARALPDRGGLVER